MLTDEQILELAAKYENLDNFINVWPSRKWQLIDFAKALLSAQDKDAARYRYMRSNATFQNRNGPGLYWYLPRWDRGLPLAERLDRAIDFEIDAAMQGEDK